VPGFDIATWYAIWAPPRTPASITGRLQQAVAAAVAVPEVREKLATLGAEPVADTPEEFAMFCAREYDRWGRLVRDARVTLD
jgi:tripartite-type tricarboxylate transporter receptor subunit TctC